MSITAHDSLPYKLRPAKEGDLAFMRALYGSTREDELAVTGWSKEQKDAFLGHQFEAQTTHYRQHMPHARWHIIVADDVDTGRLVLDCRAGDHRIVDISLQPEARGRGIGTALLHTLQASAREAGCVLSIHVEHQNRARRLYERLGFQPAAGGSEVYQLMEWRPG